jgi:hypothetical protein
MGTFLGTPPGYNAVMAVTAARACNLARSLCRM